MTAQISRAVPAIRYTIVRLLGLPLIARIPCTMLPTVSVAMPACQVQLRHVFCRSVLSSAVCRSLPPCQVKNSLHGSLMCIFIFLPNIRAPCQIGQGTQLFSLTNILLFQSILMQLLQFPAFRLPALPRSLLLLQSMHCPLLRHSLRLEHCHSIFLQSLQAGYKPCNRMRKQQLLQG